MYVDNTLKQTELDNAQEYTKENLEKSAAQNAQVLTMSNPESKGRMLFDSKNNAAYDSVMLDEKTYETIKKNLFLALQKNKSSRKTKTVHHLIENNLFEFAMFMGSIKDRLTYSTSIENKLLKIQINCEYFADFLSGVGIAKLIASIKETQAKISKEREVLSDFQEYNIDKLTKKLDDLYEMFISAFDYMKIIDAVYFEYIRFLIKRIFVTEARERTKLLNATSLVFSSIFQSILRKIAKVSPDNATKNKFNMIGAYLVLNYYAGLTPGEILTKFKKVYGEENIEFLKNSSKLRLNNFEDIADLMFETGIMKINKSLFETSMKKFFGEMGYKLISDNLQDALTFFISLNHKTILFNAISPNEKLTFYIEEIVLNQKSKVLIVPQKIYFIQ